MELPIKKCIVKYTIFSGLGAAFFLAVVYFMLTYAGAITSTSFSNGGALLHALTSSLFGKCWGVVILGIAVLLACLTTSIGLTTAFSDYFKELFPSVSYKKIAAAVCIFRFCYQQCWFISIDNHFFTGLDDDLSNKCCVDFVIVYEKIYWT